MARAKKISDEEAGQMWYLHTIVGLTNKDIAEKFNRHPTSVGEAIDRARVKIQEKMQENNPSTGLAPTSKSKFQLTQVKPGDLSLPQKNPFSAINDFAQITTLSHNVGNYVGSLFDELRFSFDKNAPYEERMVRGGKAAAGTLQVILGVLHAMDHYSSANTPPPREEGEQK